MDTSIWKPILYLIGIMAFAGFNAAYLGWAERKGAGHFQRRNGPKEVGWYGLLQPLADGIKLMSKQLLVPSGVDGILFRAAPILAMIPAITSMVAVPFSCRTPCHRRPKAVKRQGVWSLDRSAGS